MYHRNNNKVEWCEFERKNRNPSDTDFRFKWIFLYDSSSAAAVRIFIWFFSFLYNELYIIYIFIWLLLAYNHDNKRKRNPIKHFRGYSRIVISFSTIFFYLLFDVCRRDRIARYIDLFLYIIRMFTDHDKMINIMKIK